MAESEVPMSARRTERWSRREFMHALTLAGTAGFLGLQPGLVTAEPPPETTKIRLMRRPAICAAPEYLAEEFLWGEGFTEVQYVKTTGGAGVSKALASGEADISMVFSGPLLIRVDAGDPIILLAGIHVSCYELFGTERVRSIRDLNKPRHDLRYTRVHLS